MDFYPHLAGWWVFISNPACATENVSQVSTDQIHGLILEEVCELKSSKLKPTALFNQPHLSPNRSVVLPCVVGQIIVDFLYERSKKSVGPFLRTLRSKIKMYSYYDHLSPLIPQCSTEKC